MDAMYRRPAVSHFSAKRARSVIALLSFVLAGLTHAGIIDPNDFASGSLMTGQTPGATLTRISHQSFDSHLSTQAIFAIEDPSCEVANPCAAPTGTNVLWAGDFPAQPGTLTTTNLLNLQMAPAGTDLFSANFLQTTRFFQALRLDFDAPVDYLSIDFFSTAGDPFGLFLFDSAGTLLDLVSWNGHSGELRPFPGHTSVGWWVDSAIVQRGSADVASVVMGGLRSGAGVGRITHSIPEPGTFGLFALAFGFLALGGRALRR